mmetsp:Transcript_10234/g.23378  ORF Transcript_10234/g.23378 Transcript_10234/m.23378 type:complete len:230 (-) Transcript_10234:423-1112(-)
MAGCVPGISQRCMRRRVPFSSRARRNRACAMLGRIGRTGWMMLRWKCPLARLRFLLEMALAVRSAATMGASTRWSATEPREVALPGSCAPGSSPRRVMMTQRRRLCTSLLPMLARSMRSLFTPARDHFQADRGNCTHSCTARGCSFQHLPTGGSNYGAVGVGVSKAMSRRCYSRWKARRSACLMPSGRRSAARCWPQLMAQGAWRSGISPTISSSPRCTLHVRPRPAPD